METGHAARRRGGGICMVWAEALVLAVLHDGTQAVAAMQSLRLRGDTWRREREPRDGRREGHANHSGP